MIPLLESIEKNYRSVQFFPESKERTIARKGLNEVKNGMSAIFQQDSKRKWKQEEDIFSSDSGKLSIRLFLPSCGTLLNDEVFARKKHLPGVESMRYPVSMTFTDKKNEKSMVSVLDL